MYFAFNNLDNQFEIFETEKEAKKCAEDFLEEYASEAGVDGWPGDLSEQIGYGKVIARTEETVVADIKDYTDEEWEEKGYDLQWNKILDYKIEECNIRNNMKYVEIRERAKDFAYLIDTLCPYSREQSLAITKLEEAVIWANASIARN